MCVQLVLSGLLAHGQLPFNSIPLTGTDLQGSLDLSRPLFRNQDPADTSSNRFQDHVSTPMMSQYLSIWSRIPHRDTAVSHQWGTPQENFPAPCRSLDKFQSKQSHEMLSQLAHNTSLMDLQCPCGK